MFYIKFKLLQCFFSGLFILLFLFLSSNVNGQSFVGNYDYSGTAGDVLSFAYNGTAITNLTVGNLDKVGGLISQNANNKFRAENWPIGALDASKYMEFTITAASGEKLADPQVLFRLNRNGAGPVKWEWRSSVDGFASALPIESLNASLTESNGVITVPDVGGTWGGNVITVSGPNMTSITFRLYGYEADNASGDGGLGPKLKFKGNFVNTWLGATNSSWGNTANWSRGVVPSNGHYKDIPSAASVPNSPIKNNLTNGGSGRLKLESGANLTINGVLTNNGEVLMESGATFVQGATSTVAGTGTWNVQQDVIGGDVTSSVTGRFYFMGSPVSAATTAAYDAAGTNRAWSYSELTKSYTEITNNTTSLNAGEGYGTIFNANSTINYTGGVVNNGAINITGLTFTAGPKEGYNMVSNPYPSYLDWNAVTKTNIEPTIWFQTKDGSGNKVYDTYNSTTGVGVSNSGGVVNQYIAPMQGYWVEATTGGSLGLDNSMRSHQPSGSGLKAQGIDFPAFVRLNLVDGSTSDQTVVFFHENAQDLKDDFDSKKLLTAGVSQLYSSINDENIMMNGLNFVEGTTRSVPLTMSLVGENDFTLNATELHMADGSVFLEDKSNGTMQDLSSNDSYTFAAPIGEVADRFVLHFVANGGLSIAEATKDDISIKADLMGNVTVSLSENLSVGGTITVLDAAGRQVSTKTITSATTQLNVSVPTGMYFVRVSNGSEVATEKIVIAQ